MTTAYVKIGYGILVKKVIKLHHAQLNKAGLDMMTCVSGVSYLIHVYGHVIVS